MQLSVQKFLHAMSAMSLSVILLAPSLRVRFELSDLFSYYIPATIFIFLVVLVNIFYGARSQYRIKASCIYVLIFLPTTLSLLLGNFVESELYSLILLNLILSISIVIFPWTERTVHYFFVCCAWAGAVLSVNTFLFYGNDSALALATESVRDGYLTVSLAIGYGCVASLYLLVSRISPLTICLFVICWVGLALARGRGSFLFTSIVLIIYLTAVLNSNVGSIRKSRKVILFSIMIALAPVVVTYLLSLGRNRLKFTRLIFDFDTEWYDGGRGDLMSIALSKIYESPLYGNGLGEYQFYSSHPHNIFLQYGVDGGVIGIMFLSAFLYILFSRAKTTIKLASSAQKNMAFCAISCFSVILLDMMKSHDAYIGRDFFVLSAILISVTVLLGHSRRKTKP